MYKYRIDKNIWQGMCTCHVHASSEGQEVLVHVSLSLRDVVTTADPEWLGRVVKGKHKLSYLAQGFFLSFNQWDTLLYPCSGTLFHIVSQIVYSTEQCNIVHGKRQHLIG